MKIYPSGLTLGPHETEAPSKPSIIVSVAKKAEQALVHTRQIPTALILIALVSFIGNIGLGYVSYIRQDSASAVVQTGLGSDEVAPVVPAVFASSTHFSLIEHPTLLKLSAESYLVADADTGEILFEKNADVPHPMASVSKLMTAIVAKEHIDLHHIATVSDTSYNTFGTEGGLNRGEKILVADLFYPLLMESSNDAAEVLANDFGRDNFLAFLNQKAEALGMMATHYDDPSGLSPNNVSTAHDLLMLARYIRTSYPEFLDITRVKEYSIFDHTWKNENAFLTYPNFLGGKNGFIDEAKKTTVSYFDVFFRGDATDSKAIDRPIVVVLLRSDDRDTDMSTVLSYISRNIRYTP